MADDFEPHSKFPHGNEKYPYRKMFGYARVSTEDQDLSMQIAALEKHGCDRIYQEKRSAVGNRPQFNQMISSLREGDVVVVWKLDRLGRRVLDLANLVEKMNKKDIQLISLTQDINTTTPMGKVFFYLIALFAELERDMTAERTKEGMKIARAKGIQFGQPSKVFGEKKLRMLWDLWCFDLTVAKVAEKHGYKSIATITRYLPGERKAAHKAREISEEGFEEIRKERMQRAFEDEVKAGNIDPEYDFEVLWT
jgi:predicted site-specific integrase-resolvase